MSTLNKTEIALLKKARRNCLINVRHLTWGSDRDFPESDEIHKANELLSMAERLTTILSKEDGV